MSEAQTSPNKYVYLDVIGFTDNRSVESQSDIVNALNETVKKSVAESEIPDERIIYLPTGDGICIVILNIEALPTFASPYDIHLRLALRIIENVHEHSNKLNDDLRKFKIRIGINENTDNLVIDINGKLNVAGDGINTAQRVMSLADGNQILLAEAVFTKLRTREKYMGTAFRKLPLTRIKHDLQITTYQFVGEGYEGLNTDRPQRYQTEKKEEARLTKFAAYYFAHAINDRAFFLKHKGVSGETPSHILLAYLAIDSEKDSDASEIDNIYYETYKAGEADLQEQYEHYKSLPHPISYVVERYFKKLFLHEYSQYFEGYNEYRFITSKGKEKLKTEWPDIWEQFGLDKSA